MMIRWLGQAAVPTAPQPSKTGVVLSTAATVVALLAAGLVGFFTGVAVSGSEERR